MKRLLSLLRKRAPRPPKTAVFVDYEYWYYVYRSNTGHPPPVNLWLQEVRQRFPGCEITFFADFFDVSEWQKERLLKMGVTVVDTESDTYTYKKDMTDFVMLDAIYQCAHQAEEVDTFVLFTGDGHFWSVIRYLTLQREKQVILYGVQGSLSARLQDVASEVILLPNPQQGCSEYRRMILENFAQLRSQPEVIPTFNGTVNAICRRYPVDPRELQNELGHMLDQGYIVRQDYAVNHFTTIKVLAADWNRLAEDGCWDPVNHCPILQNAPKD